MANGFFQGGFAEGYEGARKTTLAEQELATNKALQQRKLTLDENNAASANKLDLIKETDKQIGDIWSTMTDTANAFREAGHTPEQIASALAPLAQHGLDLLAATGRDPGAFVSKATALAGLPAAPNTDIAKLEADRRAGYIDQATFDAKAKALTTPSGTNVTVNTGENAFAKSLGDELAKDLVTRRRDATDAVKSLESTEQARNLLNSGIISGSGAEYLLATGKALQQAGINLAPQAIANTEAFMAQRVQETGRIIKMFGAGTGLSDADREFARIAAAGKISMNEQSIRKILDLNAKMSRNVLRSYNADAGKIDPNMIPFDVRVPEPPEAPAPVKSKVIGGKTWYQWPDGKVYDRPPQGGAQ